MMSTEQRHAAMDDMAAHGCQAKAEEDLKKAQSKVAHYERMVASGAVRHDPTARCYRELKDAQMVLEFQRRAARPFDHAAEASAIAGIALNLRTGEVVA